MKCQVCRERAAIEVRRYNAAFCPPHFLDHCRRQVTRAIHDFDMLAPGGRLLLCVSGGKDSLVLWDILTAEGYRADGLYVGLGIGGYSERSEERAAAFARARGLQLHLRHLEEEYGFTTPSAAVATRRIPCAGCGVAKRYTFNRAALELGYDVCATAHNLDDEAAMLFVNVLNWNTSALARQWPVLPASPGFTKKVKPLIRLGERETAAYAVLAGIDYVVEECPLAEGNTSNRYKTALARVEEASPGSKHSFYFGFLQRAAPLFADRQEAALAPCSECGQPTTSVVCVLCRIRRRVGERRDFLEGKSREELLAAAARLAR